MASSEALEAKPQERATERTLNARILERHDFSANMAVWRVAPEGPLDFIPGQHVSLGVPLCRAKRGERVPVVVRPYSIASSVFDPMSLEFLIRKVDGGAVTEPLWNLQPGDAVWMKDRAQGKFTSQLIDPDKELVLLSTGTGLGPYMSIIRTLERTGRLPPTLVVHGVRSSMELVYFNELTQLGKSDRPFNYVSCVTREPHPIAGHRMVQGRISELLASDRFTELTGVELNRERTQIMLCGNPDMVADCSAVLENRYGCAIHSPQEPGNIFFERYW